MIKLRALALGLDVPEDDLIAVAQGKLPPIDATKSEARLLSYFRQLGTERQEDVLVMMQALARRHC